MRTRVAAATDIGHVREQNEDRYLVAEPVVAVADGMGGHLGGEVAAQLAVETLERLTALGGGSLAERVREANRVVWERSSSDPAVAGMGTTLTAAELGEGRARIAHVGDSRAYRFRAGELERLTEDHTVVHELVHEGRLTEEQAEVHPYRNVLTRVLGAEPTVRVDELEADLRPGDRLLLCSDGLTTMVPERRIARILAEEPDPRAAARRLVDEANAAGGVDNVTVVLVDVEGGDDDPQGRDDRGASTAVSQPAPAPRVASAPTPRRAPPAPGASLARAVRRAAPALGAGLALLVLALVGTRLYLDTQWYVGVSEGRVAVFRGIPAEVAGFELHRVVLETEIPAAEARRLALYRDLDEGITAADRAHAEAIVAQIRADLAREGT